MIRFMDPSFMDYLMRLRATREAEDKAFRERKRCAVAKAAVDSQGVGE